MQSQILEPFILGPPLIIGPIEPNLNLMHHYAITFVSTDYRGVQHMT